MIINRFGIDDYVYLFFYLFQMERLFRKNFEKDYCFIREGIFVGVWNILNINLLRNEFLVIYLQQ